MPAWSRRFFYLFIHSVILHCSYLDAALLQLQSALQRLHLLLQLSSLVVLLLILCDLSYHVLTAHLSVQQ